MRIIALGATSKQIPVIAVGCMRIDSLDVKRRGSREFFHFKRVG